MSCCRIRSGSAGSMPASSSKNPKSDDLVVQGARSMTPVPPLEALQAVLDYRFRNHRLLEEALTHKSFVNEQRPSATSDNERLEFLGDAVLSLVVSEQLATLLPNSPEGALSKHKAKLVSESMLADVARRLHLGTCLR